MPDAVSGAFYFVSICAKTVRKFQQNIRPYGYAGLIALASLPVRFRIMYTQTFSIGRRQEWGDWLGEKSKLSCLATMEKSLDFDAKY